MTSGAELAKNIVRIFTAYADFISTASPASGLGGPASDCGLVWVQSWHGSCRDWIYLILVDGHGNSMCDFLSGKEYRYGFSPTTIYDRYTRDDPLIESRRGRNLMRQCYKIKSEMLKIDPSIKFFNRPVFCRKCGIFLRTTSYWKGKEEKPVCEKCKEKRSIANEYIKRQSKKQRQEESRGKCIRNNYNESIQSLLIGGAK